MDDVTDAARPVGAASASVEHKTVQQYIDELPAWADGTRLKSAPMTGMQWRIWSLAAADRIAGYEGAFARKCAPATEVVHLKIPLTVNAVMHRANIDHIEDMVALALALSASRVEIAHVQY
jgi:MoaA/NifB/PqqE/SkfB family radical SAM enzyme